MSSNIEQEIVVKNLYKIFGPNPKRAFSLLEQGKSKSEILRETKLTVGVNNANFTVNKGEIFVIMGLSGSGKSTLLRCINRLIEPTSGTVLAGGQEITKAEPEELLEMRRKKIGMVFQRFGLFPHRNILKNVEYGLEVQGIGKEERAKRAMEALRLVGLEDYAQSGVDSLSGGMQQRVGLARALANDPEILLMDEPFSALDPLIRKEMQDELLQLQSKMHKTILFITHDLDEALKMGDHIAIMKDGVIVQIGTPEEILTNPADDYVAEFVQDVDRSKVLTAGTVMKKPDAVVSSKDGLNVALRKMKEVGLSSVYVVGEKRELLGLVTVDSVLEAKQKGRTLAEIIQTDIPTTKPDTSLKDLFGLAASAKVPIAVIDENNRLSGIVARVSIMAAMAGEEVEEAV